jgi:Flp pilus assembly pilin Flp
MKPDAFSKARRFAQDCRGSALAEYGIMASLLALLVLTLLEALGGEIRTMVETVLRALAQVQ